MADQRLDIVTLGEPLMEFTAEEPGDLDGVQSFRRGFGGDASNLAVATARLGGSSGLISRVGDDFFGRAFLHLWRMEGVDTSNVAVEEKGFTGVYFVCRDDGGEREFVYYRRESAASRLEPEEVDPSYLARADVIHVSGIGQAISDSSRAAVDRAITVAEETGALISYDANIRPNLRPLADQRVVFEETVRRVDLLFASDQDLTFLYPDRSPEVVAGDLAGLGPRLVVLALGAAGCAVFSASGPECRIRTLPVRSVDTTGAGDAFVGAFLLDFKRGRTLEGTARFATVVGALTTTGLGAVAPIPRRAEAEALLREQPVAVRPTARYGGSSH